MRMNLADLSTFISNVGVPVACLCAVFYMNYKQMEAHKEESTSFVEALNNNTLVIQKLSDKLDAIEKELDK